MALKSPASRSLTQPFLFRHRSKKTSKFRVTGLCEGNSTGTGEFSAQKASNAENVSILMTSSWGTVLTRKYCQCGNLSTAAVAERRSTWWPLQTNVLSSGHKLPWPNQTEICLEFYWSQRGDNFRGPGFVSLMISLLKSILMNICMHHNFK